MDYLRYYVVSLMMVIGIAGFALGGYWLWAGLGTYVVLFMLAMLSGPDLKPRVIHHPRLADIPPVFTSAATHRALRHVCLARGRWAGPGFRLAHGGSTRWRNR